MTDRHHVRIRIDAVLLHSNGKQTLIAQHWADVPISHAETIRLNATKATVDAVHYCQTGQPKCTCADE